MARMTAQEFADRYRSEIAILLGDDTRENDLEAKCLALGEEVANGSSAEQVMRDFRHGRKRAEQVRDQEAASQMAAK